MAIYLCAMSVNGGKGKKKVQLVLGSGGARGIAHIGIIENLVRDEYEIVEVVGCSMGAVVGGMYAAGFLNTYRDWLLKQNKAAIYRLFDITFSMQGFLKGERIFSVLKEMTGDLDIETLSIPFSAVATDMASRQEVIFNSGNLYKALRASTGLPGVFRPFVEENHIYVDGAVLNPLPVSVLKRRSDTLVVAVNLNGSFENELANQEDEAVQEAHPDNYSKEEDMLSRVRKYFSSVTSDSVTETKIKSPEPPNFSMFEMMNASYDASLDRLAELSLKMHPADVVIEIPRNTCSVFEFYRAAELIEIGKKCYEKGMPRPN